MEPNSECSIIYWWRELPQSLGRSGFAEGSLNEVDADVGGGGNQAGWIPRYLGIFFHEISSQPHFI